MMTIHLPSPVHPPLRRSPRLTRNSVPKQDEHSPATAPPPCKKRKVSSSPKPEPKKRKLSQESAQSSNENTSIPDSPMVECPSQPPPTLPLHMKEQEEQPSLVINTNDHEAAASFACTSCDKTSLWNVNQSEPLFEEYDSPSSAAYVTLTPLPPPSASSSSLAQALGEVLPQDRFTLARRTLSIARRALWAMISKSPCIEDAATPLDPPRPFSPVERSSLVVPTTEEGISAVKEAERAIRQHQQQELRSLRRYRHAGLRRTPAELRNAPIWQAICCARVSEIADVWKPQAVRSFVEKQYREYCTLSRPDNWYERCVDPPIQEGAVVPSVPEPDTPTDVEMDPDVQDFEFYPFELDSDEDAEADTEDSDYEDTLTFKDEDILSPGETRMDFDNVVLTPALPTISSIPLPSIPPTIFHTLLFSFSNGEASQMDKRGTVINYDRKNDWWMAGQPVALDWDSGQNQIDWFLAALGNGNNSTGGDLGYALG